MRQPLVAVSTDVRHVRQLHLARRAAAISRGGNCRRRRLPGAGAVLRRPARPRPAAGLGRRRHDHRLEVEREPRALWRRRERGQRPLRSRPRRHHPAADPQGDRARRAAARDLPRHPGTQRRARRHAGHRDPGARGPLDHRAPVSDNQDERFAIRQPRLDQAGHVPRRRLRRRRDHGQLRAPPGRRPARRPAGGRGGRRRRHGRGGVGEGRAGLCGRRPVASGILGARQHSAQIFRPSARRSGRTPIRAQAAEAAEHWPSGPISAYRPFGIHASRASPARR